MKRTERNKLMSEIMAGEDLADFRQAALDRGLQFLSRRKRQQRLVCLSALGAIPLVLAVLLLASRHPTEPRQPAISASARVPPPTADSSNRPLLIAQAQLPGPHQALPAKGASIKFITDEQLMALFPNRSVALIGSPGRQQFLFLDKPAL